MKQSSADIFVDTSVLVALSSVSRLDLLWRSYPGRLVIPKTVEDELNGRNLSLPFGKRVRVKKVKPFWARVSSEISRAVKQDQIRCMDLTKTEETLAQSLTTRMHEGEAAAYAMAVTRRGICCSIDMSAVRAKCESNGVPLLGVFGILYRAHTLELLSVDDADLIIAGMRANGTMIPRVGFIQVTEWFEGHVGNPLFG